jgi:gamma-glutamylcysteine synthetase
MKRVRIQMKQSKHAPGPWSKTKDCRVFRFNEPYAVFNSSDHDQAIAVCESEQDARLIAAAPELLEAFEKAIKLLESIERETGYVTTVTQRDGRALIAKATGGGE